MHLSHLLTLLGCLALVLAEEDLDLGYLKCVSAVVKDFPTSNCTSSHKLDCFCEAQKNSHHLYHDHRPRFNITPEAEGICVKNGVPQTEIPHYLCDDNAGPVSPRRGSAPMVRLEPRQEIEPIEDAEDVDDAAGLLGYSAWDDEYASSKEGEGWSDVYDAAVAAAAAEDTDEDEVQGEERGDLTAIKLKRAVVSDGMRLLIPEVEDGGLDVDADAASRNAGAWSEEQDGNLGDYGHHDEDEDEDEDEAQGEDEDGADGHDVYEVVTVTVTKTECPYEKTAEASGQSSGSVSSKTSAVHGTQVAVLTSSGAPSKSGAEGTAASSVYAASSAAAVPTGVDAENAHGGYQNGDGSDDVDKVDEQVLTGGAVAWGVSKRAVMGVIGAFACILLL
ncbi:hypothetical protein BJX61DRAFT_484351 [Aspergillus egyptiacus]|nr:hypothetical protein BJX61DRAFT_484351 [Aspergillus egyptiacus]